MDMSERPQWSSRAWLIAAGVIVVLLMSVLLLNPDLGIIGLIWVLTAITAAAVTVAVWALVRTRSQRRAYEQRLEAWVAERVVQEERLGIARELHDLASHGLGLMTVRASYANLTDDEDDTERRLALADIERTGREATTELRQMLSLLRGAGPESAPLRPVATLADLPGIIQASERSGLSVTTELSDLGEVPPALQSSICAVVREALTNTARHAGPTIAHLRLERSGNTIRVDVHDDGPVRGWQPQAGAGHGIIGLRERFALHHGTVTTGRAGAGFRLLAEASSSPEPS